MAAFGPVQDDCFLLDPFTVCVEHCPEAPGATSDPGKCRQHPIHGNISRDFRRILMDSYCRKLSKSLEKRERSYGIKSSIAERDVNLSNCLFHLQVRQMASTIFQFLGDGRKVADNCRQTGGNERLEQGTVVQWL